MNFLYINIMKKTRLLYMLVMALMLTLSSCDKDETIYMTEPYIWLKSESGLSNIVVKSDVKNINTYSIILSAGQQKENLTVNYEITVGDGLQQGVDFEIVTEGNSITFLPGIFDMPIRIKWLPHKVDPSKDNSLTIKLTGNSKNYCIGMPGPDHMNSSIKIVKQN